MHSQADVMHNPFFGIVFGIQTECTKMMFGTLHNLISLPCIEVR
jgi:hypothetical protein